MNQDEPLSPMSEQRVPAATGAMPQPFSAQQVEEIYREYSRDLKAFLIGVLRDQNRADDALQQTFQKVAESGNRAKEETFRGWLFQVAFREAMQIRRREQRQLQQQQDWQHRVSVTDPPTEGIEQLVSVEEVERLRQALEKLPAEQRQVVERRMQQEQTFAQIAAELDIPLGTVLTRMRAALQKLRNALNDD